MGKERKNCIQYECSYIEDNICLFQTGEKIMLLCAEEYTKHTTRFLVCIHELPVWIQVRVGKERKEQGEKSSTKKSFLFTVFCSRVFDLTHSPAIKYTEWRNKTETKWKIFFLWMWHEWEREYNTNGVHLISRIELIWIHRHVSLSLLCLLIQKNI